MQIPSHSHTTAPAPWRLADLGKVLSQAIGQFLLAMLFFGVVTPLGFLLALAGRDRLLLRRPAVDSYWKPTRH